MMYCYVIVTLILKFSLNENKFDEDFAFLGKVFPKIHRRPDRPSIPLSASDDDTSIQQNADVTDDDPTSPHGDYVFRIILFPDR